MKKQKLLMILIIGAMLMFSACADTTEGENPSNNEGLTSFVSTDINGEEIDQTVFENYAITMVNVWATTCPPCIKEMPDLAEINEDYADQNVQVVGIVVNVPEGNAEGLEAAISIVEQTGANYVHILASESLKQARLNDVQFVPETIFVDALGNQVGESYVGSKSYKNWSEIIDALLDEVE